jgi:hypothetical protein
MTGTAETTVDRVGELGDWLEQRSLDWNRLLEELFEEEIRLGEQGY